MVHYENIAHEFEPIFDKNSRILILGTFPSVKSREQNFYYAHPQNRFWKVLAMITEEPIPETIEEKKRLLLSHGIAIWDVIKSCSIDGSSDSSIRDVTVNDMDIILKAAKIEKILANGTKAYELYQKYIYPQNQVKCIKMPSTSPANAAWKLERLAQAYKEEVIQ